MKNYKSIALRAILLFQISTVWAQKSITVTATLNKVTVYKAGGEPSSYIKTADEAKKFFYGMSTVYFYHN